MVEEENKSIFAGVADLLTGASDYAVEILGQAKEVSNAWQGAFGEDEDDRVYQAPQQVTYTPNIQASDFAFQPNYTLLFGGLALLIVALFLMRK